MASRTESQELYRFGFNGKENDGETGTQDYGMRIYNPALGKFLSVDPLFKEYPWNSPYTFAENDVIRFIDIEGGGKGKPGVPTNGEIFSALGQSVGLDTKSRDFQAFIGFQDAISTPNALVNMGQHRIETLVENPWRLLAPVDIYYGLGELSTAVSTIVEGVKSNDPYYNGMALGIILQMMAGGSSGGKAIETKSEEVAPKESPTTVNNATNIKGAVGVMRAAVLMRAQFRTYLKNVGNLSETQIIKDLTDLGFKDYGQNGKTQFKLGPKDNSIVIRIDQPTTDVPYKHLQIEIGKGYNKITLDKNLDVVKKDSPEAHIPIKQ